MTPKPKAMDPDRFQMKDLKRRLTASEKYQERLAARIQRVERGYERRMTFVEAALESVAKCFHEEE